MNSETPRLPTPKRLAFYGVATVSVWIFACCFQMHRGFWLIGQSGKPLSSNFLCFWAAGKVALAGHPLSAYDPLAIANIVPGVYVLPWYYPPVFLLAAAALALLPYLWSCAAWLLGSGLAYAAALRAILPYRVTPLLAFAAPTALFNVIESETGFAVAALTGAALVLLETRPIMAGIALGLLTFKPQLGLLFPFILIVSGRWRCFASAVVTTILLAGMATMLFGTGVWMAFLQSEISMRSNDLYASHIGRSHIQTWYALASFLNAPPFATWMVYALTAGGSGVAICWLWRRRVSYNFKAAAAAVGTLLVTPYFMAYDLGALTVAIAFLIRESISTGFRRGDYEFYALVLLSPLYQLFVSGVMPLMPLVDLLVLGWILRRAGQRETAELPNDNVKSMG